MPTILVTGGAGYIGSHCCVELLAAGHRVVVIDNLANSSVEALRRVEALAGRSLTFHQLDLCDAAGTAAVFAAEQIDAVIHCAGLKSVGDSVSQPLDYWRTNLDTTFSLVDAMRSQGCRNLVFSSSATVYGDPARLPLTEDAPLSTINPYGRTKLAIEDLCRDLARSEPGWHIALLRYFNPVAAHASGRIGEDPRGTPTNLMPLVLQVAIGRRPEVLVFGGDWPTPDGTGVRDYIHVVDLALGHLMAIAALPRLDGAVAINLGTGSGVSVLDVMHAVAATSGRRVPHRIVPRRPGDVAACYADPSRARTLLGWSATRDLAVMCADGWRWQQANPSGYGG